MISVICFFCFFVNDESVLFYFCSLGFGTPAPTTTTTPSLFGTPQTVQTPAFGTPQGFPSAGGEQPFQLNKPPGSKRNKR